MNTYRVTFDRKINRRYRAGFMDVFAKNQKEAVWVVKTDLYYDPVGNDPFYPFHAKAKRIDPNEKCHHVVWINT